MSELSHHPNTNHPITNPYVGPQPFTYAQRHLFFGRDREARDLLARIVSERLLLFYAQSGAGKSSLLQTRIIPHLREEGFAVLPVGRVSGELPTGIAAVANLYLFNLMTSLDQSALNPQRLATLSLSQFLARLTSEDGRQWQYVEPLAPTNQDLAPSQADSTEASVHPSGEGTDAESTPLPSASEKAQRYVLIIDQFEEIITTHTHRRPEREEFFRQLNRALLDDPNLWVVLTLREDYVAALDPYAQWMADKLRARFYMEQMAVEAALTAVKQPAVLAGRPFAKGVAEALVDNLRRVKVFGQAEEQLDQYVEPFQLQVVCHQLWMRLAAQPLSNLPSGTQTTITAADLDTLAGARGLAALVNQALGDYYEAALQNTLRAAPQPISERLLRDWFSTSLITTTETRGIVNLNTEEETVAGLPQAIVRLLAGQSLVRAESRAGGIWYELVHDRFIQPILLSNRTWLLSQSNSVTTAAHLWDVNDRREEFLLSGELLEQAQQFATNNAHILGEVERDYLEACEQHRTVERARRNQYLAATMTIATVIALLGVIYAFRQHTIAQAALVANHSILQADKEVDTALLLAVEAVKMSNSPETYSQLQYATARSYEPELALLTAHDAEVWGAAYSPDGQMIATASQDGSIVLWNAETYQIIRRLQAPEANLSYYRVAFSPDSALVAAGGFGGYLVVWDVQSGEALPLRKGHGDSIHDLAFSPDGTQLVTVGADMTVVLWDVATWQMDVVGRHDNSTWGIWDVAFSPDGALLATASRDKTVRLWDLTRANAISNTLILTNHQAIVTSVAFHPSLTTTVLVSGDVNGKMIFWNLDRWRKARQRPTHSVPLSKQAGYVWALAFSPDGAMLASTSSRSTFRYWQFDLSQDVTQMNPPPLSLFLKGHTDDVVDIAFSPDGQRVVLASVDGTASVWGVNNGNLLTADAGAVTNMALIDDGKTLVTASATGVLKAWDMAAYQSLRWQRKLNTQATITRTVLSADGTRLLSATDEGVIQLWDVATGEAVLPPIQPLSMAPVSTLAFSHDHTQIAAGQRDGRISLWRIIGPTQIEGGLVGQQGRVEVLAFSHDDQLLAAGGCNLDNVEVSYAIGCPGEILLWDTQTRQQRDAPLVKVGNKSATGYAQLGHINALAFSHDNQKVASGSSRGLVTIWDLAEVEYKVIAENREHKQERIRSLVFSPDDSLLISAGPLGTLDDSTGTIILWDVERGVRFGRSLNEHDARVNALLLSKDGLKLYSAGENGYLVFNNLDPNYWFQRACQIANRELTLSEWRRYLGGRTYRETCPRQQ